MTVTSRKVSESIVQTVHIVRPNHLNAAGRLFGGVLMQWIDEVAGVVGKRHTHKNVTTASVDNLRFLRGAYQRDVIVIIGKVTYVGNTSMEVKVDSYVEDIDGVKTPINHAFFTMVALDDNDKPTPVPRLELETEEEREEWIDTGSYHEDDYVPSYTEGDIMQHPSQRVGEPADIARAVLFLCDERNSFINGENITIDGGMSKLMIYHNDYGWDYQP